MAVFVKLSFIHEEARRSFCIFVLGEERAAWVAYSEADTHVFCFVFPIEIHLDNTSLDG
jgi:hypothetical protein